MQGSGYSCPRCKKETGDTNEVMAGGGLLRCSKNPRHEWNDVDAFYSEGPTVDFQKKQQAAPQPNHSNINVSVPVRTVNRLQERYGEKMAATLTSYLNNLAEGNGLTLSAYDLERLKQTLPEMPKNASHLYGMVFALAQQANEAKAAAEAAAQDLKGYQGMAGDRLMIDLGDALPIAREKAKEDNLPTPVWIGRKMAQALKDSWF